MNLQENISRVKELMGLINESTEEISKDDQIILISDFVKNHIKGHNQFGLGSTFREGITDDDINEYVNLVLKNNVLGDGGAFEINVPNIGFDLVKPYDVAKELPGAQESVAIKKERGTDVEVPLFKTSLDENNFATDRLTLIIRKSNPNFLPEDVKENPEILKGIDEGKVYSLLTAFPGNPDIPPASEWKGQYAVVVPTKRKVDSPLV